MKLFTVVSPDKISISMFTNFLQSLYGEDNVEPVDINHLNSTQIKQTIVEELIKKYSNTERVISVRYKLKAKIKFETTEKALSILPSLLVESSNYIVWFDLYSQQPIVMKDRDLSMPHILESWNAAVQALSH